MKKIVLCALVVLASVCSFSQQWDSIYAANSSCVYGACVWMKLPKDAATVSVVVTGTFSQTLAVETSADGGTTLSSEGAITAAGTYTYAVASKNWIQVRASAYTSGTAKVSMQSSTATAYPTKALPLNIMDYGAIADERDLYDCSVTAGSKTMTCSSGAFTPADNSKVFLVSMGAQGVVNGTYTSGITATGAAKTNCTLTFSNGGGSGATAKVYLSGTNTVTGGAAFYITNYGTGFTSAPTQATASDGTATCSGTVTVASTLGTFAVKTTGTVVNSTTVTLGTNATTSGTNVKASIGTDNTTAAQNWLNACMAAKKKCYMPYGQYAITSPLTITNSMSIEGDGAFPEYGDQATFAGYQTVLPAYPPYVTGSIFVMLNPSTDVMQITSGEHGLNLSGFGARFAPGIAMWQTGNGINATPNPTTKFGLGDSTWDSLRVWGADGNHYAFVVTNANLMTFNGLSGWGGGGILFDSKPSAYCCAGNFVLSNPYFDLAAGGSSYGITLNSDVGSAPMGLISMLRPQANVYPIGYLNAQTLSGWPIPALNPYAQNAAVCSGAGGCKNVHVLGSDFETMHSPQFIATTWGGDPNSFEVAHNAGISIGTFKYGNPLRFGNVIGTGWSNYCEVGSDNALMCYSSGYAYPMKFKGTVVDVVNLVSDAEYDNGTCTTSKTISYANGNKQKITLTNGQACALAFTQPPSTTNVTNPVMDIQLRIIQSSVSTYNGTISGCKWPAATVPTISVGSGKIDLIRIYMDGTNAYCSVVGQDLR